MRSTWQLFLVSPAGDSLPPWGGHHYCVRWLSLPEDHSPSQASPSPPPKGLKWVPALSPHLGGGKQCLHHAARMGDIKTSTWSMDSCLWPWHWALSASPCKHPEEQTFFLIALKLAIYAAPSKEDSSGVPHSLLTLTELHFRDQRQAYAVQQVFLAFSVRRVFCWPVWLHTVHSYRCGGQAMRWKPGKIMTAVFFVDVSTTYCLYILLNAAHVLQVIRAQGKLRNLVFLPVLAGKIKL